MNREDLATALERHATDAANEAAQALRAGAAFRVWEELQSAHRFLNIWAWRAECMAQDGVSTCKDFDRGYRIFGVQQTPPSPWDESPPPRTPTWSS